MNDNPSVPHEFRFQEFWHGVFEKWLRLLEQYEDPEAKDIDLAYWHGERALTMTIQPGRYRHYKGDEYTVIDAARHSEAEEELVVYRQKYGDHGLRVRPKAMFFEMVEVDGQMVPRFKHLGSG